MSAIPAVRMRGICKRFGAVAANRDVDLTVAAGTVHGIVGENGAGKSTLMSVLYGFYPADEGDIQVNGRPLVAHGSRDAIAAGIGMVHQHFMLVDSLSALDNVMLGAEPGWRLMPARRQVRDALQALMARTGLHVRLDQPVEELPVGERQRLEILKTLYRGARILILDEPTAVLTPQETAQLFDTLRGLRASGTTVLLITHKLKEILALCDAVTVMRGGAVVLDTPTADTSLDALAQAMVGRRVNLGRTDQAVAQAGDAVLQAEHLSLRDALGVARLDDVSLTLRAGEIVGIAGVSGNGQQALMAALSGEDARAPAGSIRLFGQDIARQPPGRRRRAGLHFVPEERLGRGAVPTLSLAHNTLLTRRRGVGRGGWLRLAEVRAMAAHLIDRFQVKAGGPGAAAKSLSGGNLQKFIVGREIDANPRLLIVSQPTWGVDVGAAALIRAELLALRDAGAAVLVVSEELEELFEISDRLLVIAQGRVSPSIATRDASIERIGQWMSGLWDAPPEAAHAAA